MSIPWREDLAIGVEQIDQQHKAFFNTLNNLLEVYQSGKWREEIEKVLLFLEDYTVTHFKAEEKLQKEYVYPDYPAHKAQHARLKKDLSQLKKIFKKEGATPRFLMLITHVMSDWCLNHTGEMDQAFGLFLKRKIPPGR